jgi:hypothetical protein
MNPDPRAVLAIAPLCFVCSAALVMTAIVVVRYLAPWIEGLCGRHEQPFFARLAMSEDAALSWAAKWRARALLLSKLDAKQRRSWRLRRRFDVVASSGRRYTLAPYRPFNIRTQDALFCVQVHGRIPAYDKLLAQKLLIEADEQLFLARANVRTFSRAWEPRMAAARARYPVLR